MVKLTKIYTRGGDKGKTSLAAGGRVAKHDLRVAAYGTVDEANAAIGLVRLHTSDDSAVDHMLGRIQNDLFDLGADLATPPDADDKADDKKERLRITEGQVAHLESEIDAMNEKLSELASFILPGGTAGAATLHMARTIVRRAERDMTALAEVADVGAAALKYINRLSDHLFVTARRMNDGGKADVLWQPGANR